MFWLPQITAVASATRTVFFWIMFEKIVAAAR